MFGGFYGIIYIVKSFQINFMPKNNESKFILTMSDEALDNLPFGAYVINKEGIIEFFNKEMAMISGVKEPDVIVGQNVFEIPTYKKYGLIEFIKRGLEGKPLRIKGIQYVSHVGKKESFRDYYGIPIKNEQGEVVRLLCLVEDATKRRQLEEQVVADLRDKEALLSEISHRAKNNMRLTNSILNLQAANIKDEEALRLIEEGKHQIKSMMMIQEKIYQESDSARINFREYLSDLVDKLFVMYNADKKTVKYKLTIGDLKLGADQAVPCALIVNELVSNALKYAFTDKRKGEINISLKEAGADSFVLDVDDNGAGFADATNISASSSLGIRLVKTMVEEMGGDLDITDRQGIKVRIRFPKDKPVMMG